MRMLLTSAGVTEGPIRDRLLELLDAPPEESRCVAIIDAMLPFGGDRTKMLADLEDLRGIGWAELNVMSLLGGPRSVIESRLRSADVLFCYGGTNHWLAHAWTSTGLAPVLRELLDEKVYIGLSAGSMIFSRLHEAAVEALDDQEEVDMLQLPSVGPALPLLDWYVVPHLGAPFFPHSTDAWATGVAGRLGGPVWFIDDTSALVVRDPEGEPEIVSSGHWLRFDGSGRLVDSR